MTGVRDQRFGPRRTRVSRMRSVGCGVPLAVASAAGGACVM